MAAASGSRSWDDALAEIRRIGDLSDRLALVFVAGPGQRTREGLDEIAAALAERRTVLWHPLDEQGYDLAATLDAASPGPTLLLVYGLERMAPSVRIDAEVRLNLQRDGLARFPALIVLWVPAERSGLDELRRHAPDLFHWRSLLVEVAEVDLHFGRDLELRRRYLGALEASLSWVGEGHDPLTRADGAVRPFSVWAAAVERGLVEAADPVDVTAVYALRRLRRARDEPRLALPLWLPLGALGGAPVADARLELLAAASRELSPNVELDLGALERWVWRGEVQLVVTGIDQVSGDRLTAWLSWCKRLIDSYPRLRLLLVAPPGMVDGAGFELAELVPAVDLAWWNLHAFLEHQLEVVAPISKGAVDLRVVPVAGTEIVEDDEIDTKRIQLFRRRWDALLSPPGRRTLLVGVPGAGKTVSLAQLAVHLTRRATAEIEAGKEPSVLPIWMEAREVPVGTARIVDVLAGRLEEGGVFDPPPLGPLLEAGRVVLLVDGLQEVGEAGERFAVVERLLNLPGLVKVATTRPGFDFAGFRGPQEVLLLRGLQPADREALAEGRGLDAQARERVFRLTRRGRLADAVDVPQVWTMALELARRGELDPEGIDSPGALYEAFLRSALEAGLARLGRREERELDPADVRAVLELLGAAAIFGREAQVEQDKAVRLCGDWMEARRQARSDNPFPGRSSREVVRDLPRFFPPVRVRDRAGGREIAFAHGSLADALAARFLHRVCPHRLEPVDLWEEPLLISTLAFYGELLEQSEELDMRELDAVRVERGSPELLQGWLRHASLERLEAQAERLVRRIGREADDRWRALALVRTLQRRGPAWMRQRILPHVGALEEPDRQLVTSLLERGLSRSGEARRRREEAQRQRRRAIAKMRRKHRVQGQREEVNLPALLSRLQRATEPAEQVRLLEGIMVRGEEGPAAAVVPLLDSEDGLVARTAAKTLRVLGDHNAVKPLLRALRHPSAGVRSATAKALGLLQDETAIPELEKVLAKERDQIPGTAAALALGLLGAQGASATLKEMLSSSNSITRATAATALGWLGQQDALSPLIDMLDPNLERDGITRGSAATALGQIGDPRAVDAVIRSLDPQYEDRGDARGSAATALGQIGDPRAVDALIRSLDPQYEDRGESRGSAATALGQIGDPRAVDALIRSLDPQYEDRGDARGSAATALGQIGDPRAVDALIRSLDPQYEDRGDARGSAATALGQIGDPRAVDALIRSLDPQYEDDGTTRGSAATALGQIGDPRAERPLRQALKGREDLAVSNSLRGALRRLQVGKRRPEESARRLDAAWPRLFERFLDVTAHPGDPVFAASLRRTLENFVKHYGDEKADAQAEPTSRLEERYQRHLAGFLGQLGYEIIEQGVPGEPRRIVDPDRWADSSLKQARIAGEAVAAIWDEELLPSSEVATRLGASSSNREKVNVFRRRSMLLGLPRDGGTRYLYPAFQIDVTRQEIYPEAREVNQVLGAAEDPWGVASWWVSANGRLGARPMDLVGTDQAPALVAAAKAVLESPG